MSTREELTLRYEKVAEAGTVCITAWCNGVPIFTDKVDVTDAGGRKRFLGGLCDSRRGIDEQAVSTELEKIAGDVAAMGAALRDKPRKSQADSLVELAGVAELFHTPGGHDSEGYATVPIESHRETWPIASKAFRRWLARQFFRDQRKAPGAQALQDAINVLAGMAVHDGPELSVAVRIAEHGGAIYVDLADAEWRVVEIAADGWRVITDPPVRFIRRGGELALPVPTSGGSIDDLRRLVNVPDDDAWHLVVGWIIAAFRPGKPFTILVVNGEQGSAKSTLCRMIRSLVDPNAAPIRRPPRIERDLMIAATNSWVLCFDNLSSISSELSDALCCIATGGGFASRELYSDGDEKLFSSIRPVIINGIAELATRSDLLDRSIILTLPAIPEESRREEEELWQEFDDAQPRILGAILSVVASALARKAHVKLPQKPRMADFAKWVVAAEPALGWRTGEFLDIFTDNRAMANSAALDESILASPIQAFMAENDRWEGTATGLLSELCKRVDEKTQKRREWPSRPNKLSSDLRRLAPNLRRVGIHVEIDRKPGGHRRRCISLERVDKGPSPASPGVPSESKHPGAVQNGRDDRDGRDDEMPLRSHGDLPGEEVVEWTA